MVANHDLKHRCPHDNNKCPHCGTGEPEETTQTRPEPEDHLEEASRQHPSGLVAIIKPLG